MIDVITPYSINTCNGAVTEFTFDFKIISTSDLVVYLFDTVNYTMTELDETDDYEVSTTSGNYNSGGTVQTVKDVGAGPAAYAYSGDYKIGIFQRRSVKQETDYINGGTITNQTHENTADHLVMLCQHIKELADRSIKIPEFDDRTVSLLLPYESQRKSKFMAFNSSGKPIASDGTPSGVPVSTFAETMLDDENATEVLATLGVTISTFAKTFLDDETATAVLTTLGFSSFAETLIDDTDAETARATLEILPTIAAFPVHYERDAVWAAKGDGSAAERYTLLSPSYMTVNINNNGYVLTSQQELDLSDSDSWDTDSPTDYTTAANRAGADFYIYAVEPASGTTPDLILSANSSYPSGYTADNSRKVGGFHCLCVSVGTISGHDLSDYVQGDILPASVWDLKHRPVSDPEGMVWDENSNVWWDIYLASWSSGLQTVYDATIVDGASSPELHWYNFVEEFAELKKRLPTQQEFMSAALGSPQETNISGSADPGTTGGHSDTASRRIISNIGCEDMTGVLWQWGADGGATNDVGSAWAVADTAGTAGSLDNSESIGRGQHYEAPNRPLFGGGWGSGADCGSRGSSWSKAPLVLSSNVGARGVAEPKR